MHHPSMALEAMHTQLPSCLPLHCKATCCSMCQPMAQAGPSLHMAAPLACTHSWAPCAAGSLPGGSPFHPEKSACRVGEAAAETRINMLDMHEDLCPLCRRVIHCVLPGLTHAVTAGAGGLLPAQPAPSLEQLEAHLQAVLLVPDTAAGAPYIHTAPLIAAMCTTHTMYAFSAHHIATAGYLGIHS